MGNILFGVSTIGIGVLFLIMGAIARRPSSDDLFEDRTKSIMRQGRRGHAIIGGVFCVLLGLGFLFSGIADVSGAG
jgi:hypothetical protein